MSETIEVWGGDLAAARREGTLIAPLPAAVTADDGAAYTVQRAATRALAQPLGGWKIGATAAAAQQSMGRTSPFYGPMPAVDCHADGALVRLGPGARGVEIELAFKLAKDLPKRPQAYTLAEVKAAVASIHPAIEVVAIRQKVEGAPRSQALIADFGGNGAFVHGPAIPGGPTLDLAAISASCSVDGEEQGAGSAAAVMGDPWNALLWFANEGPGMSAGMWISSGTMTGLAPIAAGQEVVGDLAGLGAVRCRFS